MCLEKFLFILICMFDSLLSFLFRQTEIFMIFKYFKMKMFPFLRIFSDHKYTRLYSSSMQMIFAYEESLDEIVFSFLRA